MTLYALRSEYYDWQESIKKTDRVIYQLTLYTLEEIGVDEETDYVKLEVIRKN